MTFFLPNRRRLLGAAALAVAALMAGCATPPPPPKPSNARDYSAEALAAVNAVRAKKGLSPVAVDPAAAGAAVSQARRMVSHRKMAHLLGPGDDFKARMKGGGVALPASENVATGQDSLAEAIDAWVKSPRHLHNMLGDYSGMGVAVAYDVTDGNRPYWAMVLSNPR